MESRSRTHNDQRAHLVHLEHRGALDWYERSHYDLHLAGGFIEAGMNWWQAMLTILLGNTIVLIPMILNAHAGTKYGVSFPVLCRAAFGVKGANVPAILRAVVACGWFGIQTWIAALALNTLFTAAWPGWTSVPGGIAIAFA